MAIGIMDAFEQTTTSIRNWAENKLKSGLDKKVDKVQGKVLSDNNYSEDDKNKVNNIPNNLIVIDRLLYLAKDNERILDSAIELPAGGGGGSGGGGSGSANVTATALSSQKFSIAFGATEVWIKIRFQSDSIDTGTAYVKDIDGNILGYEKLTYGDGNNINIAKYIKGTLNTLYIACQDDYGNSAPNPLKYEIQAVTLSLVVSFDDSKAVTSDAFTVHYKIKGEGYKKLYFIFDGVTTTAIVKSSDSTASQSISIKGKTHGVYSLKVYAETILSEDVNNPREDEIISSDQYEYRIMYAIGATPLISSVCNIVEAEQYAPISIPISVHDRDNDNPTIDCIVSQNGIEYSRTTMVVPKGSRVTWPARVSQLTEKFQLNSVFDFTIAYKNATPVTHRIKIVESSMDISARRQNLLFELTAADKSNHSDKEWHSEVGDVDVTLSNVNWDVQERTFTIIGEAADGKDATETKKSYAIGTGWRTDEDNNVALRLSGDARATINFKPFQTDWVKSGATLEMEFAIRDVNNRDEPVISCIGNNLGFKVTADTATLFRADQILAQCNYVDDEKIRIVFVLEDYTGPLGNKVQLITAYLNGVLSSASTFSYSDSFLFQNPAQNIEVGSSNCSIDLYMMRFYDAPLSYNDVKNNYISDNRRHDLWVENDIYFENEIVYDKLVDKIPIIRTTGIRPTTKNETKSKEKGGAGIDRRVDVIYTNKSTLPVIKEDQVKIHVQGTSSEGYIRKNYDLDFAENYQIADGQIPTDYFCLKTDYAEATGTHNTGHANYVHNFYTKEKFGNKPPFSIDSRARTTIFGFPCVIFHRDSTSDPKYTFVGKYNFNFSKDSENVFGFTATDPNGEPLYRYAQSWEFAENKYAPCKFLTDPDTMPEKGDDNNPGWELCFEDRYKSKERGMNDFKDLYRWVYSTNQAQATGQKLSGSGYTGIDGTVYTHDTKEYRLAKFKKEFEEHFDLDFTLVYYVYTFVMLMVDQRAKNQFLTSWDGQIWAPWLYDND